MVQKYHREYLQRLPLPLAQLYSRAHNDKDATSRHNNAFFLFEALIKLATAPLIAGYLQERQRGPLPELRLNRLLAHLALPSLGQWIGMLRELARFFGERHDAGSHPLGHLWAQLKQRRTLVGLLTLFQRIKNGPEGDLAHDQSCSILQVFEGIVQYRNGVFGHGGPRRPSFFEGMGSLLFPAANDLLAEGVLDLLGPPGSRLVYITELRCLEGGKLEVGLRELIGLQSEPLPSLSLPSDHLAELAPNRVALLWPGQSAPLRLDPLLQYTERNLVEELLFLNREHNGRKVEYLSYTTGDRESEQAAAPALAKLLSGVTGREVSEEQLRDLAEKSQAETSSVETIYSAPESGGTRLGDYELLGEIGRGGMGVVYLARQLSLGRLVAMKMLPADLAGDEVALARFNREIRALAHCEHPHIVKLLVSGKLPDGRLFYAMEYVPGCTLEQVWRELSAAGNTGSSARLDNRAWVQAVTSASHKQREHVAKQFRGTDGGLEPEQELQTQEGTPPPLPAAQPALPPRQGLRITDCPVSGSFRLPSLTRHLFERRD